MLSFQQMQEMQHSARDTELETVASWNKKVFILQPAHFHSTFALVCHLITEKAITSSYVRHATKQNYLILFHRASCFPELWHRSQALKQFQIPMRESWCHIEIYVFSQEFLCWNTTRFHPQFNLHSRIRPDFRRKKGFRWNILETVTGQMLGDFCHGWRPCAEIVLLDLMPLGHRLYTGLRSGSLCVFYAERLFHVTIFQTETDDSVLFYICTNTLTSSFVQNRKNNSKCVKRKFPCAAWYLLKEPEILGDTISKV